jgi:hypothetical protein
MTVIADIDTELAAWDIHTLRGYAEEIELGNNSTTTTTGEPIEWTRAGSPISNRARSRTHSHRDRPAAGGHHDQHAACRHRI